MPAVFGLLLGRLCDTQGLALECMPLTRRGSPALRPRQCVPGSHLWLAGARTAPPSCCAHPGVAGQALPSLWEGVSHCSYHPSAFSGAGSRSCLTAAQNVREKFRTKEEDWSIQFIRGEAHGSQRGAALIHSCREPRVLQPLPRNQNIHPVSVCARDPSWPLRTVPGPGVRPQMAPGHSRPLQPQGHRQPWLRPVRLPRRPR